jgi:hypothetical protein
MYNALIGEHMRRSILLLVVLIIVSLSCKKDENPASPSDTGLPILPLKTGNAWVFRWTSYDTTGATTGTGNDTLMVGRDTLISGAAWYQFTAPEVFWTNKADGAWRLISGPSPLPSALAFKYPANAGDVWNLPLTSEVTLQLIVVSTGVSVTVPKGSYNCYQYNSLYGTRMVEGDYLCPGVGLVAYDVYSVTSSGRVYRYARSELVSLVLK